MIPEGQPERSRHVESTATSARITGEDSRRAGYSQPPSFRTAASKQKKRLLPVAVISAVTALSIVFGVIWLRGSHEPAPTGQANRIVTAKVQKTISLNAGDLNIQANAEAKALLATWQQMSSSGSHLDPNTTTSAQGQQPLPSIATALAILSPQQRQEMVRGDRSFYKVVMFDNQIQDGDGVEVFLNGNSIGVVDLSNAGIELAIPLKPGETAELSCLAVKDGGGGGVTFGARSSTGEQRSRVMELGESETWNLNVQ